MDDVVLIVDETSKQNSGPNGIALVADHKSVPFIHHKTL